MDAVHHLSIDIETYSSVDIGKAGLYKYVQAPDFQILLFAYSLDGTPVQVIDLTDPGAYLPQEVVRWMFDPGCVKHAYNAAFEWACLSRYFRLGSKWPPERWLPQWRCTMLHGLYCGYTAGLDATAKALGLPEDKQKLSAGRALIRYFCAPDKDGRRRPPRRDPERWKLFCEYNAQDVVTEMEIERRLSAFPVPDIVQRQWEVDQAVNARGVAVDMDLVAGALEVGGNVRRELTEEAVRISGLRNPNSQTQLRAWLARETGGEIADVRKDTVAGLLGGDLPSGAARRMLEIRQELGKTSTKKYDAMAACACEDGRARGLLQFYGANRTGRWAGRLIQVQNLPRTYLPALPLARELVKGRKTDALRAVYGSVPDTLSQLIRTAFVAPEGMLLVDADFSAIEARVIAWLAGEAWVLDVFRTTGKIYEAAAAQMFGIPVDKIRKGNPEYSYRQRGKVATLALGYQGSTGALVNMGALAMGIPEEELPDIVSRWRQANPHIVGLWYDVERAAMRAAADGVPGTVRGLRFAREIDPANGLDFLTVALPGGRKLYYAHPHIGQNRFGRDAICYYGMNQTSRKWEVTETYGGKLVENCLAGDTPVLTARSWIPLKDVLPDDLLWDGVKWVGHRGIVEKGVQTTIEVDGVRMTPDHLILTKEGWKSASSCEGYYRNEVELPDGDFICGFRREKVSLEHPMRLRETVHHARVRVSQRETKVVRLPAQCADLTSEYDTRYVKNQPISRMAFDEGTLYLPDGAGVGQLWRSGNSRVRSLVEQLREFLRRHGPGIQKGAFHRPHQRRWKLLPGKLPLGIRQRPGAQQTRERRNQYAVGAHNIGRSIGKVRDWGNNAALSDCARMPGKYNVRAAKRDEPVFDIADAGPRHRFTVLSKNGPMIVHNCVQAIARDCLAEAITRLEDAGYHVVFHVHDEVVIEADGDCLEDVVRIMSQPVTWAPGLPLAADGWVDKYFKKD